MKFWPRRRFLKLMGAVSAGIAASGAISGRAFAAATKDTIITRPIPVSGERVPAIGLGTARNYSLRGLALGQTPAPSLADIDPTPDELEPLREVMRVFHELGGRVIDSSPMYGTAEELIGLFGDELGVRDELFMATKVWTDGRAAGERQMQTSMELMGRSPMDIMLIHNLRDWRTQYQTLREWQDAGRIRYIGISHSNTAAHEEVESVLRSARFDILQINYNGVDRNAEKRLLPLAEERGLAVMVNEPFGNGRLFQKVRGQELPAWAAEFEAESWGQVFLKFILGHPAVTCPIPATSNPRHVADNVGAAYGALPNARQRRRIVELLES